jgi:hypothetical protein
VLKARFKRLPIGMEIGKQAYPHGHT